METQIILERANKWLNEWKHDLSFISTHTLHAAFMEGYRSKKNFQKEKEPQAYRKGIDWVEEYNRTYRGTFFTRDCVLSAYLKGLTLNI